MFSNESTFAIINPRAQKDHRLSFSSHYKQKFTVVNVEHSMNGVVVVGLLQQPGRPGINLLLAAQGDDEQRPVYGDVGQDNKLFPFIEI
jgi:hypothetical protein